MNIQEKVIFDFLNNCDIVFNELKQLDGVLIHREMLISEKKYKLMYQSIIELKKVFSSSSLTCLQNDAPKRQKWPLLNLVRQILKTTNYKMIPKRKSNGYDDDGKKKYVRFFLIKKITDKTKDMTVEGVTKVAVVKDANKEVKVASKDANKEVKVASKDAKVASKAVPKEVELEENAYINM